MRRICGNCAWFVDKETCCGRKVGALRPYTQRAVLRDNRVRWSDACRLCRGKYFVPKIGEKLE